MTRKVSIAGVQGTMPAQRTASTALAPQGVAPSWTPLRHSGVSLVDQLADHIAGQIRNHGLRAGMRLPSVRTMSTESGLSRFTVVQAYDKLVAQGLIQSRKGSGFYVAPPPTLSLASSATGLRIEPDAAF